MMLADLAAYLEDRELATFGEDLFAGRMNDDPPESACLYEYPGGPPERVQGGNAWANPSVQLVVRDSDYAAGRARIEEMHRALTGLRNTVIDGTLYLAVLERQEPFFLERDKSNRVLFACNYDVQRAG
jgi:hypothetical protein